jgi:hypothetical protein
MGNARPSSLRADIRLRLPKVLRPGEVVAPVYFVLRHRLVLSYVILVLIGSLIFLGYGC